MSKKQKIKTPAKFKWTLTVEIEVAPIWVADGYFPDVERIKSDLMLSHVYESEMKIKPKITAGPTKKEINAWMKDSNF